MSLCYGQMRVARLPRGAAGENNSMSTQADTVPPPALAPRRGAPPSVVILWSGVGFLGVVDTRVGAPGGTGSAVSEGAGKRRGTRCQAVRRRERRVSTPSARKRPAGCGEGPGGEGEGGGWGLTWAWGCWPWRWRRPAPPRRPRPWPGSPAAAAAPPAPAPPSPPRTARSSCPLPHTDRSAGSAVLGAVGGGARGGGRVAGRGGAAGESTRGRTGGCCAPPSAVQADKPTKDGRALLPGKI